MTARSNHSLGVQSVANASASVREHRKVLLAIIGISLDALVLLGFSTVLVCKLRRTQDVFLVSSEIQRVGLCAVACTGEERASVEHNELRYYVTTVHRVPGSQILRTTQKMN